MVFSDITLYGPIDALAASPPIVIIEFYDYDNVVSHGTKHRGVVSVLSEESLVHRGVVSVLSEESLVHRGGVSALSEESFSHCGFP